MLLITAALKRVVSAPINQLTETMSRIEQQSDLSLRVPVKGKDEIACAGQPSTPCWNASPASWRKSAPPPATCRVSPASWLMFPAARSMASKRQLADTESLASTLHQLAGTVQEVANNTREAASAAIQADNEAKEGAPPRPRRWARFRKCRNNWNKRCKSSRGWTPIAATSAA
jgi:methyl-accepting chemotaxis protein